MVLMEAMGSCYFKTTEPQIYFNVIWFQLDTVIRTLILFPIQIFACHRLYHSNHVCSPVAIRFAESELRD
jgi:hypothetical protein